MYISPEVVGDLQFDKYIYSHLNCNIIVCKLEPCIPIQAHVHICMWDMTTLVHITFTWPELSGFSTFFDVSLVMHMTAHDVSMT